MADGPDPRDQEAAADAPAAGCVVFLVDESTAMDVRVAEGTKSKAECVATALNSLLNQLTAGPELDVAVVGCRSDGSGRADVGCRWGGSLSGQTFIRSRRLADAPVTVENRVRKIPAPGGVGTASEQTVQFPVWYVPSLDQPASPAEAFEYCHELLSGRLSASKPPLVMSLLGEPSAEGSLSAAVGSIRQMQFPGGPPLVFHAHLSSSARIPPTLYPSADGHLPPGAVREIFQCSGVLPELLADALRQFQVAVNPGARGMVYNAKMVDLIRFLSLVKAYAEYQPPAAAESGEGEQLALIVLLADRSVEDPLDENSRKVWTRLQEHANELLGQISKRGKGMIEAALVCYGADAEGRAEVQTALAGPLAGKTFVTDAELAVGALRVEEVAERVSNGIGGLVEFTRKKPIFVDLEPTPAVDAESALRAVAELVADWCGRHRGSPVAPIVLHLTRPRHAPDRYEQTIAPLHQAAAAARGALLYHLVATDLPHRSLAYPGQPAEIADPVVLKLWESSSPLLGARRLAAERPAVAVDSRGIVINGKFDLLLDAVMASMGES